MYCVKSIKMEYYDEEDSDISWLTQVPSLEGFALNFSVGEEYYDDESVMEVSSSQLVSLEDGGKGRNAQVLYNNVVCEDLSSDEEGAGM